MQKRNDLWHLDLCELSASKLINLAITIANNGKLRRVSEREVKNILAGAITVGTIKYNHLSQNLKVKFK